MTPSDQPPPAGGDSDGAADSPYRVLIVEDDRSQALFAERVLSGSGIQAQVVTEPAGVLEAMDSFQPDLVLMDLHMPEISGTELTARIREQESFLHTPIVFLTGDPDPERQFEVLESGADDFLSKPVRPRHLIAAVLSRVKRARALGLQRSASPSRHPQSGLFTRTHLQQRISTALESGGDGGAFFVEIEGASSLHERFGYASYEQLMNEAGRVLAGSIGRNPAARLNDNAFLVVAHGLAGAQLEEYARTLRDVLTRHSFDHSGTPLRLRASVGYTALSYDFAGPGDVINAAERAVRQARADPIGLAAYAPPEGEEIAREREFATELRDAIADDRLELQYQPIVAVAGGEEAQYQTLLRMRDSNGVLRTAAEIVPAAEATGLIQEMDRWVLQHAIDLLGRRNKERKPVRLFVSQSPQTLSRDGYAEWLREAIAASGVEGPSLVIDVRLPDALVHAVTLRQFCDSMVPTGVQFCLAQYEHGADADVLLAQLPLGCIRLSARYADAHGTHEVRDEMRTVIDRAHRLGLQVIGQRVEDPQAAATLWMSGIDYIQGNLVQQAADQLDFDFHNAVL